MAKDAIERQYKMTSNRVIVYVDGFNLYYGLKCKGWKRYYWLDLQRLAETLLLPGQVLVAVRYFTTSISSHTASTGKSKRQATFLEALQTRSNLHIYYGHYLAKLRRCSTCGATWKTYEEKMTDVNIAVTLFADAVDDAFDNAIIISGDSDLSTVVSETRKRYMKKRLIVAFPPARHSAQLRAVATAAFTIGRKVIKDSQLPDEVTKPDGFVLRRPAKWN